VKLITEVASDIFEVLEVEENRFRVVLGAQADEIVPVFVYGREVDDFHAVDYDAIAMLNVSATQELAKRVEQLQAENRAQQVTIAALQAQLQEKDGQAARISNLESQLQAIQALLQGNADTGSVEKTTVFDSEN
jgi:hypothetical protein